MSQRTPDPAFHHVVFRMLDAAKAVTDWHETHGQINLPPDVRAVWTRGVFDELSLATRLLTSVADDLYLDEMDEDEDDNEDEDDDDDDEGGGGGEDCGDGCPCDMAGA